MNLDEILSGAPQGPGPVPQTPEAATTFPRMVSPQTPSPVVAPTQDPAEIEQRKTALEALNDRIKGDPNMMRALMFAGAAMMRPVQPGQSVMSHLADSALVGVGAYDVGQQRATEEARAAAEETRKQLKSNLELRKGETEAKLGEGTLQARIDQAHALADKAALEVAEARRSGDVSEVLQKYRLNMADVQGSMDKDVLAQHFFEQMMKPGYDNAETQAKTSYYDRMPKDPVASAQTQMHDQRVAAFKVLLKLRPENAKKSDEELNAMATVFASDPAGLQVLHAKEEARQGQISPAAQSLLSGYLATLKPKETPTQASFDAFVRARSMSGGTIGLDSPEYREALSQLVKSQEAQKPAKKLITPNDVDKMIAEQGAPPSVDRAVGQTPTPGTSWSVR